MVSYLKECRESVKLEQCFVCGKSVSTRERVYWDTLNVYVHSAYPDVHPCQRFADRLLREYTHSGRGRWRSKTAVLADIWAARLQQEPSHGHQ